MYNLIVEEINNKIIDALTNNTDLLAEGRTYNLCIYDDGIWSINIRVDDDKKLVFYVTKSKEKTEVNIYTDDNGDLNYIADYFIDKKILDKIYEVYLYLLNSKIVVNEHIDK